MTHKKKNALSMFQLRLEEYMLTHITHKKKESYERSRFWLKLTLEHRYEHRASVGGCGTFSSGDVERSCTNMYSSQETCSSCRTTQSVAILTLSRSLHGGGCEFRDTTVEIFASSENILEGKTDGDSCECGETFNFRTHASSHDKFRERKCTSTYILGSMLLHIVLSVWTSLESVATSHGVHNWCSAR